jgi:hypothetical protein
MLFRDFVNLQAIGSPFICGGFITRADCLRFFCMMHAEHREPGKEFLARWRARQRNGRVLRRLRNVTGLEMIAAINKFIDRTFLDAGSGMAATGETPAPIASSAASIVDSLASDYGWSISQIMSAEMILIFQLFRLRYVAEGGKRAAIINRFSSRILGEHLRKLNEGSQNE